MEDLVYRHGPGPSHPALADPHHGDAELAAALEAERRVLEQVLPEIRIAVERVGPIEVGNARYMLLDLHESPPGGRPIARYRISAGTVATRVLCRQLRNETGELDDVPCAADGRPAGTYAWRPNHPFKPGRLEVCNSLEDLSLPVADCGAVLHRELELEAQAATLFGRALAARGDEAVATAAVIAARADVSAAELLATLVQVRSAVDGLAARVLEVANQAAAEIRQRLHAGAACSVDDRVYSVATRDVRVQVAEHHFLRRDGMHYESRLVDVLLLNHRPVEQPASPGSIVLSTWDVDTTDAATLLLDAPRILDQYASDIARKVERAERTLRAAADAGIDPA